MIYRHLGQLCRDASKNIIIPGPLRSNQQDGRKHSPDEAHVDLYEFTSLSNTKLVKTVLQFCCVQIKFTYVIMYIFLERVLYNWLRETYFLSKKTWKLL